MLISSIKFLLPFIVNCWRVVLHVDNAQVIRVGLSYRANDVAEISKFCEIKDHKVEYIKSNEKRIKFIKSSYPIDFWLS